MAFRILFILWMVLFLLASILLGWELGAEWECNQIKHPSNIKECYYSTIIKERP